MKKKEGRKKNEKWPRRKSDEERSKVDKKAKEGEKGYKVTINIKTRENGRER